MESPLPLFGLYDVGSSRLGHAQWLRQFGESFNGPTKLMEAAILLEEAGRRWNVFNSLRSMHDRLDDATSGSRDFIINKTENASGDDPTHRGDGERSTAKLGAALAG
jgi:hypothetical protein